MDKAQIAKLLERYKKLAEINANVNFGDKASVRKGNRAATEMSKISNAFIESGEEGIKSFAALLDETENRVQNWAAIAILESMKAPKVVENKALAFIEKYSKGDDLEAFGTRMWLADWKSRKSKMKR